MDWCKCMDPRPFREALADLFGRELIDGKRRGEFYELFEAKSLDEFKDEASDIAWGFGRLIAGLFNRAYVRVPGDARHYRKAVARTREYGCKRSRRFLVDGRCPSE